MVGTGKFKTKRGGSSSLSRDLVLDHNGVVESKSSRPENAEPQPTRDERREPKKKQAPEQGIDKDNKDADPINPNHTRKRFTVSDLGSRELTQEEREAKEEREANLKEIREERQGAQAKCKAEAKGAAGPSAIAQPQLTYAERRKLKKEQAAKKQALKLDKDDEDADFINPNHVPVQKIFTISNLGEGELTRNEREAKEKQEAKNRYWKLHRAGKTDKAKSDLARLRQIKEEREVAQAKRMAETEAKAAEIEAKKKAAMNGK